jgi:hypothetical protein
MIPTKELLMAEIFCQATEVVTSFYNIGTKVLCLTAPMERYSWARGTITTSEIMSLDVASYTMLNLKLATNQLPSSSDYDWDQHQW